MMIDEYLKVSEQHEAASYI